MEIYPYPFLAEDLEEKKTQIHNILRTQLITEICCIVLDYLTPTFCGGYTTIEIDKYDSNDKLLPYAIKDTKLEISKFEMLSSNSFAFSKDKKIYTIAIQDNIERLIYTSGDAYSLKWTFIGPSTFVVNKSKHVEIHSVDKKFIRKISIPDHKDSWILDVCALKNNLGLAILIAARIKKERWKSDIIRLLVEVHLLENDTFATRRTIKHKLKNTFTYGGLYNHFKMTSISDQLILIDMSQEHSFQGMLLDYTTGQGIHKLRPGDPQSGDCSFLHYHPHLGVFFQYECFDKDGYTTFNFYNADLEDLYYFFVEERITDAILLSNGDILCKADRFFVLQGFRSSDSFV